MKSLVRWGTTMGLVGSTVLATVLSANAPVFALTEQQIKEKLDPIPVFLITNNQGIPLSYSLPNGQNGQKGGSVTDVFMSGQEAQAFINDLRNGKAKDPKLAEIVKSLQVTAFPLGIIYQKSRETASKPDRLQFAFKPAKQELDGAMSLLRQSGQQVKQFPSVPVFIVRSPEKGYVLVKQRDNKEIVPLFFSQRDAQGLLKQVKQQVPKADIQVVDLNGVIAKLGEKNDALLNQFSLVPSSESLEYISKQPTNNVPKPDQNQLPATRPSAPAPKK